jgi:hypothetical protein
MPIYFRESFLFYTIEIFIVDFVGVNYPALFENLRSTYDAANSLDKPAQKAPLTYNRLQCIEIKCQQTTQYNMQIKLEKYKRQ